MNNVKKEKWSERGEFFDRLAEKLEEMFPKDNQEHPERQSTTHRSEALSFNAFANIFHKEILSSQRQTIIEEVIKILINSREQLADIEHQRWSDWQKYMHSKMIDNGKGFLEIDEEFINRWATQIRTPYSELSEKEKDSDREQVERYLPMLVKKLRDLL